MEDTTKTQILDYIQKLDTASANNNRADHINIGDLSKECGVSRQRVWQLLERIGETRHKRKKKFNTCRHCGTKISRYATNCKHHAKPFEEKKAGHPYQCRICKEIKPLEEFSRNKKLKSGYENRCLECRATWQREYSRASKWKNAKKYNETFLSSHPERTRAYYQINRAIKKGVITKPKVCEVTDCTVTKISAIHRDYADPLNVAWLCRLHARRTRIKKKEFRPNLFEEDFRSFVFRKVNHYNSPGRWLSAIKRHYGIINLSASTFVTAYQERKNIGGLGPRFTITALEYMQKRGYGSDIAREGVDIDTF